eukprot:SM000059S18686  [mRNA]  locus=s59:397659:400911:+ [translate_table: standard]
MVPGDRPGPWLAPPPPYDAPASARQHDDALLGCSHFPYRHLGLLPAEHRTALAASFRAASPPGGGYPAIGDSGGVVGVGYSHPFAMRKSWPTYGGAHDTAGGALGMEVKGEPCGGRAPSQQQRSRGMSTLDGVYKAAPGSGGDGAGGSGSGCRHTNSTMDTWTGGGGNEGGGSGGGYSAGTGGGGEGGPHQVSSGRPLPRHGASMAVSVEMDLYLTASQRVPPYPPPPLAAPRPLPSSKAVPAWPLKAAPPMSRGFGAFHIPTWSSPPPPPPLPLLRTAVKAGAAAKAGAVDVGPRTPSAGPDSLLVPGSRSGSGSGSSGRRRHPGRLLPAEAEQAVPPQPPVQDPRGLALFERVTVSSALPQAPHLQALGRIGGNAWPEPQISLFAPLAEGLGGHSRRLLAVVEESQQSNSVPTPAPARGCGASSSFSGETMSAGGYSIGDGCSLQPRSSRGLYTTSGSARGGHVLCRGCGAGNCDGCCMASGGVRRRARPAAVAALLRPASPPASYSDSESSQSGAAPSGGGNGGGGDKRHWRSDGRRSKRLRTSAAAGAVDWRRSDGDGGSGGADDGGFMPGPGWQPVSPLITDGRTVLAQDMASGVYFSTRTITGADFAGGRLPTQLLQRCFGQVEAHLAMLRTLRHPNIVPFYGCERAADAVHVFSEHAAGTLLSSRLWQAGPMPEAAIATAMRQVLEGLAYLHANGVMHGELRGAAVLVAADDNHRLIDFGLVTPAAAAEPNWVAPELLRNESCGPPADLWSAGCLALEMATSVPPWSEQSTPEMVVAVVAGSDVLPEMPARLSSEFASFVGTCLRRNPCERPLAAELLRLHPFLAVHPPRTLDD